MTLSCSIADFLDSSSDATLIDVRSPIEFEKGHITGATNIPLFTDEERAHVGTVYKQVSAEKAYEIGLNYVTPKLGSFVEDAKGLISTDEPCYVHCWRGGQRSHAFAKHLDDNGISPVGIIEGGYKAYRNFIIEFFQKDWKINILGGYTGSGKTHILQELRLLGEQVIDLEGLAKHKGSAFGTIKMSQQPTTEQFSNNLYHALRQMDSDRVIWIEDESINIGQVKIPVEFFQKMKAAPTYFVNMDKELRAEILVSDYELDCDQELKASIGRITRKLGGQNAIEAISQIDNGDYKSAALICLRYYDKLYKKGLDKKQNELHRLDLLQTNHKINAKQLLAYAEEVKKMNKKVRLTQYSHGAGCGCKIAPGVLNQILQSDMIPIIDEKLLVGNDSRDDAAVYDLGDGSAIISTTDFFMPIVDDPMTFGKIAATNALSDIYAMGGNPMLAIAILGWPIKLLGPEIAGQVIDGGREACKEAGIILAGGHSIDSPEPIFGLAVTGRVTIADLKRNNTATEGCLLYLTKPLGVGILSTAQKKGLLRKEDEHVAAALMTQLNNIGLKLSKMNAVKAMTDVTGFGLLGHLTEMCQGSNLSAVIESKKVPVLPQIAYYLSKGAIPGGTNRNWDSYGQDIHLLDPEDKNILCDPQTSGGLLIAVAESGRSEVEALLEAHSLSSKSFGRLENRSDTLIRVV